MGPGAQPTIPGGHGSNRGMGALRRLVGVRQQACCVVLYNTEVKLRTVTKVPSRWIARSKGATTFQVQHQSTTVSPEPRRRMELVSGTTGSSESKGLTAHRKGQGKNEALWCFFFRLIASRLQSSVGYCSAPKLLY